MRDNPYVGINAHLNSMLQTPGTLYAPSIWPTFHTMHNTHIAEGLNEQLPRRYVAYAEQSLQTRGLEIGERSIRERKPDVTVFQRAEAKPMLGVMTMPPPSWEATLIELIEPIQPPHAVVIRELLPHSTLGNIVARIELLSPSNMRGGTDATSYAIKRVEAILSGIPLIEIDYLHESPSPFVQLPLYPIGKDALAYNIIVSDPRPTWAEGKARVYSWGVGEPIKIFPLPLADDEMSLCDLNPVYQHTWRAGRWENLPIYDSEPPRIDTYSTSDQAIIGAVMAKAAGQDES